ncbi:RS22 [Hepatospora eriocheir]|uniref:RS22 n=1 Tax=Hepatospora eriocheir TaxID=1081669 RepID=A0A1X0QB22_9MICR|nr:RS22 [Hepatospora eriocheir]ORD99494.1 RS22 [Hepatospora eriocheir]
MSALANACKAINNANKARKSQVCIMNTSKELKDFLIEMKKHGYVSKLVFIQSCNKEKAVIRLNGRLNKCGAILPRSSYKCDQIQAVSNRLKPARQFGHVLFKTCKGVVDQNEANEMRTGGKILGFFY